MTAAAPLSNRLRFSRAFKSGNLRKLQEHLWSRRSSFVGKDRTILRRYSRVVSTLDLSYVRLAGLRSKWLRRPSSSDSQGSVRALLPSFSLLFGDRTNDQLAFTCFDERRISLRLGSIKQFLNFRPA